MTPWTSRKNERFLLWVDGVGGYLVVIGSSITLGQPADSADIDIPIWGDLSKRHAKIRRDDGGYVLEALWPAAIDGRPVEHMANLVDGSRLELGRGVVLTFRRPHPLSATARLDFASGHRTRPSVDGVLLLADSCVVGPAPTSHIVARQWNEEVMLFRHDGELFCRAEGLRQIDGQPATRRGRVTRQSRVLGEAFSLSLEAL